MRTSIKAEALAWNPRLSYAIGLITTDGNLSSDGRHIDFTSKDRELVQTFKECLSLNNEIGRKARSTEKERRYFRVQFGNVEFYRQLLGIGLTPAKSKTLGALKIPAVYFADFLRGHLDGDGCIRSYLDPVYRNSIRLYTTFSSASPKHIYWLQRKIQGLVNIKGFIRHGKRVMSLTYAKKESISLCSYLYHSKDIPCLERKYRIAKPFLSNPAQVVKLANTYGSGPYAARLAGSTPALGTL